MCSDESHVPRVDYISVKGETTEADALQERKCCCVAIVFLYAGKQLLKKLESRLGQG